jgi:hypothetical protein
VKQPSRPSRPSRVAGDLGNGRDDRATVTKRNRRKPSRTVAPPKRPDQGKEFDRDGRDGRFALLTVEAAALQVDHRTRSSKRMVPDGGQQS